MPYLFHKRRVYPVWRYWHQTKPTLDGRNNPKLKWKMREKGGHCGEKDKE